MGFSVCMMRSAVKTATDKVCASFGVQVTMDNFDTMIQYQNCCMDCHSLTLIQAGMTLSPKSAVRYLHLINRTPCDTDCINTAMIYGFKITKGANQDAFPHGFCWMYRGPGSRKWYNILSNTFGSVNNTLSGGKYPHNVRALRLLTGKFSDPSFIVTLKT